MSCAFDQFFPLPTYQPTQAQSIYMALIEVFLVKVRFPADSEFDEWSCEEKEQFRCYRQDISDTIVYAYNVLGESLLVAFVNALNSLVTSNGPWQNVEAVLFLFSATSEGRLVYLVGNKWNFCSRREKVVQCIMPIT